MGAVTGVVTGVVAMIAVVVTVEGTKVMGGRGAGAGGAAVAGTSGDDAACTTGVRGSPWRRQDRPRGLPAAWAARRIEHMYEVSGSVVTLGEGVAIAAGFVRSERLSDALLLPAGAPGPRAAAPLSAPPDLDDPWLGDPWADVWWGGDDDVRGEAGGLRGEAGGDGLPDALSANASLECSLDAPPGPELVALLDRADITALGASELVDAVAGWERVVSWARGSQAVVVAELAGRAEMLPRSTAGGIASLNPVSVTAAELAAALPLTKAQAENLVGESVQLVQDFPVTLAALRGGRLDPRRAKVVMDELGCLEPEARRAAEASIIATTPDPTDPGSSHASDPTTHPTSDPAVADPDPGATDPGATDPGATDPGGADAAVTDAGVEGTGVAATDTVGIDAAGGADTSVLRRRLKGAVHELAPVTVAERVVQARARRFVRVTPARDGMAWLEALLPAEDAMALKSTVDAAAGELKRRDTAGGDPRARTVGQRRADALSMLAWASLSTKRLGGHHCECPSAFGVALGRRQGRPVSVNVTVPFATLTGSGDAPGELAGYGPIPAPVARRLAGAGVWRWLGHDPVTGALLSYGRTRYTPPAELVEFIVARDAECRMPGCHRSARGCELDHTIPYPVGVTAAGNLGALCSFHHHLKHHTHWSVTQPEPGVFVWTSPTGRTSTVVPADLRARRHHRANESPHRPDGSLKNSTTTDDQDAVADPDPPSDPPSDPPDHRPGHPADHPPDLPPF